MSCIKHLLVLIFLPCFLIAQKLDNKTFHPYSNKVIVSTEIGATHSYTDYLYPKPELLGRSSFEYFFRSRSSHAFGLKIAGGISKISAHGRILNSTPEDADFITNLFFIGSGFTYARAWGYSVFHLSALISHLRINPKDSEGNLLPNNLIRKYDPNHIMYSLDMGIRFLINDFWSINLGMNYNVSNIDYLDDIKLNESNDNFLTILLGISLYHGGDSYSDSDEDGIKDNIDVCPETPKGISVNSLGCPQDSDTDGVPDYLDNCPRTPMNILVDKFGCPRENEEPKELFVEFQDTLLKIDIPPRVSVLDFAELPKTTLPYLEIFKLKSEDTEGIEDKLETEYNFAEEDMLKDLFFTDGKLFCFQVGSFTSQETSSAVAEKYISKGHNAFVVKANPFNDERVWYRIRIGFFNSLEEAKKYKSKL